VNSSGAVLQVWTFDPVTGETKGTVQDITLSSFTSPPQETTIIKDIINLDAGADIKSY
jgi:hypothetical protein